MGILPRSVLLVILAVIVYGGGMLVWTSRRRKAASIKPAVSYADVLYWGFVGLGFGVISVYGWRAFHRPQLYLTIVALIGISITATIRPATRLP